MKKIVLMYCILLLGFSAYSQQAVRGKVTDSQGVTLPGVNVLVKGTTTGTVTDVDGNYNLTVTDDATLVFSFVGFTTEEVRVNGRSVLDVQLTEDITALQEVVVVGYGTAKKKELTGAVSDIKADQIQKLNPTRIENALQGQVAGVSISTNSGSPGGGQNIRIRGLSTNGDNNPLVVVDGVTYGAEGLSALNPADIESISILKDATAGIYGVQSANGVIIVTTKKGKRGQSPEFSFDGYYGIQETANKIDVLNANEYAVLKNEAAAANGSTPPFNNTNLGVGTDWQDEVFERAPIQNYNLTARGGTEKSTYSIGGSYYDQKGIVGGDKSSYTRYNGRINFTTDLSNKVTFDNVLLYTHEDRKTLPENTISSVLFNALNISPIMTVFDENGNYTYATGIGDVINPVAQIANTYNDAATNKLTGKLGLTYDINDNFELSGRAGYNYALVEAKTFSPLVYYGAGKAQNTALNSDLDKNSVEIAPGVSIPVTNSVTESKTVYFDYNLEAFLNYNKTFGDDHRVKATLGASVFAKMSDNVSGTGHNVPYNSYEYADLSATDGADLLNNSSSYQSQSRLQSFFLRAEYMYKQRYLLSAVIRRDGSSRFGANNKFGYFPSVSGAWIISEENFFKNLTFIDFAKLRGSYGKSGNDKIQQDFAYRGLLNGEGVYPFNDQLVTGTALGFLSNPDLKWEETTQRNIGLDLGFFDDALSLSVDYYVKNTKDLLFRPDVSGLLGAYGAGGGPPYVNIGKIKNQGLELAIKYSKSLTEDLSFNVSYNVTTLDNEVTGLPKGIDFYEYGAFGVGGSTASRMEVGYPIGYFFGYKTNGVYQSAEEVAAGPTQLDASAGDLRYIDLSGDGNIDFSGDTDKTIIGSPIPDVTMGLNLGLEYKGFDFSTAIFGSFGNDILRNYERQTPLANLLSYRLDRWTGAGSSDDPRLTTGINRNNVISDYYVEDGSYVRIKNIQLGYTLPAKMTKVVGLDRCRIYAAVNNLYTITGYKGYDPDLGSSSPLTAGIDYGFYPQARTYMIGLNLNF